MIRIVFALLIAAAMYTSSEAATAPKRTLNLVNETAQTVTAIYVSPAGRSHYSPNVIPNNQSFDPGDQGEIDLNDPNKKNCWYDLHAVLADGTGVEVRRVNACVTGAIIPVRAAAGLPLYPM